MTDNPDALDAIIKRVMGTIMRSQNLKAVRDELARYGWAVPDLSGKVEPHDPEPTPEHPAYTVTCDDEVPEGRFVEWVGGTAPAPPPAGLEPTAEWWLYTLAGASRDKQLTAAGTAIGDSRTASRCFMEDHRQRIELLESRLRDRHGDVWRQKEHISDTVRERDQARGDLRETRRARSAAVEALDVANRERDEARAERDNAQRVVREWAETVDRVAAERDEARDEATRNADHRDQYREHLGRSTTRELKLQHELDRTRAQLAAARLAVARDVAADQAARDHADERPAGWITETPDNPLYDADQALGDCGDVGPAVYDKGPTLTCKLPAGHDGGHRDPDARCVWSYPGDGGVVATPEPPGSTEKPSP